jgi:general secretion pathway protein E
VVAQRLVRVLCKDCREAYEIPHEELIELGLRPPDRPVPGFKPTGCAGCNYTGYRGRLGIFELMLVDDAIRAMIASNTDSKSIKATAQKQGMHSMRSDGARKVLQGITSVAEVIRATEDEGVVAQV